MRLGWGGIDHPDVSIGMMEQGLIPRHGHPPPSLPLILPAGTRTHTPSQLHNTLHTTAICPTIEASKGMGENGQPLQLVIFTSRPARVRNHRLYNLQLHKMLHKLWLKNTNTNTNVHVHKLHNMLHKFWSKHCKCHS